VQGSQTPYFDLQRQLLERGIERFARRVSALSKESLVVEANYVEFGSDGSVVGVTNVRTVQLNAAGPGRGSVLAQPGDYQTARLYGGVETMPDYNGFQTIGEYGGPQSTRRR
jgi:hypothetical protein